MVTSGYEWYNSQAEATKAAAIAQAADLAYKYKRLELIDVPMLEIEKDRLAFQAAQAAVEAEIKRQNVGLGVLNLVGSLRGPRNAFAQQNVMYGMNGSGVSRAVDAIAGRIAAPAMQAPQARPQGTSIQTFLEDIYRSAGLEPPANVRDWRSAFGGTPQPAGSATSATQGQQAQMQPQAQSQGQVPVQQQAQAVAGTQTTYTAPGFNPNDPNAGTAGHNLGAYLDALPAPNRIVGREWLKLPGDSQEFLLGAYEQAGYSGNDVSDYIKRGLPQFRAPTFGSVR